MDDDARRSAVQSAVSTEHFALQSAYSAAVGEGTGRATIYVMSLSSFLVATGFVSQSDENLLPFVGTVLPGVFVLGALTTVRLLEIGAQCNQLLVRIVRIRRYYRTLESPGAPSLFTAWSDDEDDLGEMFGMLAVRPVLLSQLGSISSMIAAINTIVGASGIGILAQRLFGWTELAVGLGVVAALAGMALYLRHANGRWLQTRAAIERADGFIPPAG